MRNRTGGEQGSAETDGRAWSLAGIEHTPSLTGILCKLYSYHVRLQNEFETEVEKELKRRTLDKAISSGAPVKLNDNFREFPSWLRAKYGSRREAAIRDAKTNRSTWKGSRITPVIRWEGRQWHRWPVNPLINPDYDERVMLARSELIGPMRDSVRKRHGEKGKPVEQSGAWNFAVGFVAEHMKDLAEPKGWLVKYCAYRLFQSAPPQERSSWLADAIGGIRGSVIRSLTDGDINRRRGREHTILTPQFRELQDSLLNHPDYRKLACDLRELDELRKGDELLREVWRLHRAEAADAPLPPAPPTLRSARSKDKLEGEQPSNGAARQGTSSMFIGEKRWLDSVVACVHEDTRDPRKVERYHAMIRDWADEMVRNARPASLPLRDYLKREHPSWTDDELEYHVRLHDLKGPGGVERRGEESEIILSDPIGVTTHAGTPLNKKYATLAAIHDAAQHCHFPLDPWAKK